jgi:hypothetical protein
MMGDSILIDFLALAVLSYNFFFWIIEVTVVNSYILFKESQQEEKQNGLTEKIKKKDLKKFQVDDASFASKQIEKGNDVLLRHMPLKTCHPYS